MTRIVPRTIEDELKNSYLAYSLSVIVGRALPDVRDGLKPVHRRILFAMRDLGMLHNKPFKKCARIVGEVLGKYHPHGDASVYDALVRLAQDFSLRYPLVEGQGNFGSLDGDSPASMRYTEARLSVLSEELLKDLEKETVDFGSNFDDSLKEPLVLPTVVPNLLVNGSSGIAVGMATNIPPHNMGEVCDGVVLCLDAPSCSSDELLRVLPGPDFPTGGIIRGRESIRQAYETGRGKILVRGKVGVEKVGNRENIIISEIPFMVNKSLLVSELAGLVQEKRVTGVSDIRDESDRDGVRIVLEVKQGMNSDVVINQLFKYSRLQESFSIILLAIVDGRPRILSMKEILGEFINHRNNVIRRRTEFDVRCARERLHIVEGLLVAVGTIDAVVALIRGSKDGKDALDGLMRQFSLSEIQGKAILDMKLQRLTGLEREKLGVEREELVSTIKSLEEILSSEKKIVEIIRSETLLMKEKYGDMRRTLIMSDEGGVVDDAELVKPEDVVITLSHAGYVKRLPVDTYRQQHRGGRGVIGADTRDGDFLSRVFIANTQDFILCFTSLGRVHWLRAHIIPEAGRYAKGSSLANLIQLDAGERVTSCLPVSSFQDGVFIVMVTRKGVVKKVSLSEFSNPRKGGIAAITLADGDELLHIVLTDGERNILLATRKGMAVRFSEKTVRPMGRTARGVTGVRLRKDDGVVGCLVEDVKSDVLTITTKGFGKRTSVDEYRLTNRGGVGVTNVRLTEKNGDVVGILPVLQDDEVLLLSKNGVMVRIPAQQVSRIGRNTQGVRVMKLGDDDVVMSAALVEDE